MKTADPQPLTPGQEVPVLCTKDLPPFSRIITKPVSLQKKNERLMDAPKKILGALLIRLAFYAEICLLAAVTVIVILDFL